MSRVTRAACLCFLLCSGWLKAQVYSPKVLLKDQIDSTDARTLADGIIRAARALTPREKAEAIWRFFLTDGRFVAPGFWYHLGGWVYEEPRGEVLDPVSLLNSYGFGLCYHVAPLLQAVYDAAGFEDARVWFLTGHTVAEVFYDGGYHYFDADLMGYNPVGRGPLAKLPVASVKEVSADPKIMLDRLDGGAPNPFYPGDVKVGALEDVARLFTTTSDNWLFPFKRYPEGRRMDLTLRPGERLIRYLGAEEGIFYLPYTQASEDWQEFPKDVPEYKIFNKDGPHSQRDDRLWATGRLEYRPPLWDRKAFFSLDGVSLPEKKADAALSNAESGKPAAIVIDVRSPYVLIDAKFSIKAGLSEGAAATLETSTDGGLTWAQAGRLEGPHQGEWTASPKVLAKTANGAWNAVAGTYGYLLRLTLSGNAPGAAAVQDLFVNTRVQVNLRSLPRLARGRNDLTYSPGPQRRRWTLPIRVDQVEKTALRFIAAKRVSEDGHHVILPAGGDHAEIVYELSAPDGSALTGIDVGGRFLDLREGLAPNKRNPEVRPTRLRSNQGPGPAEASLEWATTPDGPYHSLWRYDPELKWRDGAAVEQVLRWPEVDREVRDLPAGATKVYVRYRLKNIALDDIRLSVIAAPDGPPSPLEVIHVWFEGKDKDRKEKFHIEKIADPAAQHAYSVEVPKRGEYMNYAVIFNCPAPELPGAKPAR